MATNNASSSSLAVQAPPPLFAVSDARNAHAQYARSTETALAYAAVILAGYLAGMLLLLLHHVK